MKLNCVGKLVLWKSLCYKNLCYEKEKVWDDVLTRVRVNCRCLRTLNAFTIMNIDDIETHTLKQTICKCSVCITLWLHQQIKLEFEERSAFKVIDNVIKSHLTAKLFGFVYRFFSKYQNNYSEIQSSVLSFTFYRVVRARNSRGHLCTAGSCEQLKNT